MEPKSGFTPYGTPESSLGVTATHSSDEYPTAQPRIACPAVPAMPASREEKSDSSRRQRSERDSSSETGSSAVRREARMRKLQAAKELAEAKCAKAEAIYALAEAEYEDEIERSSCRSGNSRRSRSTRGESKLNLRVSRERDRTPLEMQE